MSGTRLSSCSERSSLGSSLIVEKSIVGARSERYLRTRSSTIVGIAKIFLRIGSCMRRVFRARVESGIARQVRGIRGAAPWFNGPKCRLGLVHAIRPLPHTWLSPGSSSPHPPLDPTQALGDYLETYVEHDVRRIGEVRDLSAFQRFVRLCAGRVGQLADLGSLGSDAGIPQATARHWLPVLEASYVVFQLPPFFSNIRKRLVKSPKLYFHDVGLASHLLGIENAGQVATHPLRGPLFGNAVVVEALKHRFNTGRGSNLSFFRDADGLECDLLYENGNGVGVIETKSGTTIRPGRLSALDSVAKLLPRVCAKAVIQGGTDRRSPGDCEVVPLRGLAALLGRLDASAPVPADSG